MTLPSEFYTLLSDIWPIFLIFAVAIISIRISYIAENHEKFVLYKEFFSFVFIIYILLLFELVTNTDVQGYSNNFIPFREILRYDIGSKYFIWNVIGNVLLFTPYGFAISLYLKTKKSLRPFIICFITSLTIESVQMFIGRSFDIDDIILNCIGGLLGFLLYRLFVITKEHLPKFLRSETFYNILTVLIIVIIIFYCISFGGLLIK